ncbi:MAG: hypothetical protein ABEJ83_02675 [Candidatus Nanohaloarchaea archaeon]
MDLDYGMGDDWEAVITALLAVVFSAGGAAQAGIATISLEGLFSLSSTATTFLTIPISFGFILAVLSLAGIYAMKGMNMGELSHHNTIAVLIIALFLVLLGLSPTLRNQVAANHGLGYFIFFLELVGFAVIAKDIEAEGLAFNPLGDIR